MNRRRRLVSLARAAAVLGLVAPLAAPLQAATATGNFQVSATVVSGCTVSATTLNFGSSIDPTTASVPLDASSSMTVMCTATTSYSIALNAGANAGGASVFTNRQMKNGTHYLGYQLYLDTTRATVWGDGTASSVLAGVGIGSNQTVPIYGRLPSLSGAVPGTYTDTVTVTITY